MVGAAVLSILAAYGLARFRIRGKRAILLLFMVSQMLPQISTLVPNFLIFQKIGIYNTYWAAIFADMTLGIPFCILMMRTYFLLSLIHIYCRDFQKITLSYDVI